MLELTMKELADRVIGLSSNKMEPLIFSIPQLDRDHDTMEIKLHLVGDESQTEQHDTGFVMWPASVVLARWIAMNPDILKDDKAILEIGAGCGLVGLTVATMLAQQKSSCKDISNSKSESKKVHTGNIIFSDYNPVVLENIERNISLNKLGNFASVAGLDFFDQAENDSEGWVDMNGSQQPQVELILAADILPYSNDAVLVARTIETALVQGGTAILLSPDEDLRFGVEQFPEECRNVGLQVEISNSVLSDLSSHYDIDSSDQSVLVKDLEKTTGFVSNQGYSYHNLRMFMIRKPMGQKLPATC